MYVVVLAGGIASGKSTVARELASRGACLVDLDMISREVTAAGSPVCLRLAQEFGGDVLDGRGALRRGVLARRAFASQEATKRLERITHPAIRERLAQWLDGQSEDTLCVVEVPLLDRMQELVSLSDEVLCVVCSLPVRRARAVGRGMEGPDFDARVTRQPADDYLVPQATTVLNNDGDERQLMKQIDDWWLRRARTVREFRVASTKE